jgi:hypothetical protein
MKREQFTGKPSGALPGCVGPAREDENSPKFGKEEKAFSSLAIFTGFPAPRAFFILE